MLSLLSVSAMVFWILDVVLGKVLEYLLSRFCESFLWVGYGILSS